MKRIITVLATLAFCAPTFAQSSTAVPVKLGGAANSIADRNATVPMSTIDAIVNNKAITVMRKGCDVTSFAFSILPKSGDFIGPFMTNGYMLTDKMLDLVKNNTGKIFIENVKVKCGTQELTGQPIIIKYDQ